MNEVAVTAANFFFFFYFTATISVLDIYVIKVRIEFQYIPCALIK